MAKHTNRILLIDDTIKRALHVAVRAQRLSDEIHQLQLKNHRFTFAPDVPPEP
jgi:hypothetical protein